MTHPKNHTPTRTALTAAGRDYRFAIKGTKVITPEGSGIVLEPVTTVELDGYAEIGVEFIGRTGRVFFDVARCRALSTDADRQAWIDGLE